MEDDQVSLPLPQMVESLRLERLDARSPGHAAVFSLPVPPGTGPVGVAGLPSQSAPIAWWPEHLLQEGAEAGEPRRVLVTISSQSDLPAELHLTRGVLSRPAADGPWTGPTWETRVLEKNYLGSINWEVGELVLRMGEREVGLRLGLMTGDGSPMWWEWLQV